MATYVEDIIQALKNLGGQAKLADIYDEVDRIRTVPQTKNWKFNISGIIGNHCPDSSRFLGREYFRKVGNGFYALSDRDSLSSPRKEPSLKRNLIKNNNSIPESFETIANILKTIKEYRDYSTPGSEDWITYIQDFFHILGFNTEKQESRLVLLKEIGVENEVKAVVDILLPGENFLEISPGIKWESHLRYEAHYYHTNWGILFNGLQLKVIDFDNTTEQARLDWPNLDEIITQENPDGFFPVFKIFSGIKGNKQEYSKKPQATGEIKRGTRKKETRIVTAKKNPDKEPVVQFVEKVLHEHFGGGFRKIRGFMYESASEIVYFQNSKVDRPDKKEWWYRVVGKTRKVFASSNKKVWLCLTNIPTKTAYIIPMQDVEKQARASHWERDDLEISIYFHQFVWHQLGKWNIEKYRHTF
jgi:hypothetical protein